MKMKKNHRWTTLCLVLVITVTAGLLGGCGGGENDETQGGGARSSDEVVIAMPTGAEPEAGFDPCFGWGAAEHAHEPLIQSTLLVTDKELGVGYDLAKDYQISPDGMTWTVTIRDDVRFTDGQPLTAKDVAFTYEKVKETTSINDLTMMRSCEAPNDTTVLFHMNQPNSTFAYTMAIVGILPEHAYTADYGQQPIGSGRYKLEQWDKGQQVIFTANEDYYGEAPKMKKVTFLFMSEDAALAAAKAGTVDMAYTAATLSDQKVEGMHLEAYRSVDNRGISMPTGKPGGKTKEGFDSGNAVTSDLAIRRALAYGLNREEMAEVVLNGHGTAAYSVCDGLPWYNPASEISFDLKKALGILEEGGWKAGADGVREKDGVKAKFTLLYPTGDSVRQAIAAETANLAKELGIEIEIEGAGWDDLDARVNSTPMLYGWGANNPMEIYNLYRSGAAANPTGYANAVLDGYMDQALAATDVERSYELWKKAQWDGETGITPEGDYPWVWLLNIDHLYFVKDGLKVAKQKIHPHGTGWAVANNVDQWTWE